MDSVAVTTVITPTSIPPWRQRSSRKEIRSGIIHDSVLTLWNESTLSGDDIFDYCLDRIVYVSAPSIGIIHSLLKFLPLSALNRLAKPLKFIRYKDYNICQYGPEGVIIVRKGNRWGFLCNVSRIVGEEVQAPLDVLRRVINFHELLEDYGLPSDYGKSVGGLAQNLAMRYVKPQYYPPFAVRKHFAESSRYARSEGCVFGYSRVKDYDMTSAFGFHTSKLMSTNGMEFIESTKIINEAFYASIVADVYIEEDLVRGPIGVNIGRHQYFPVGELPTIRLNKPEIDLLLENPGLGKITKIYEGYWGVPKNNSHPFRPLMRSLYEARKDTDHYSLPIKLLMNALWGKFYSSYVEYDEDENISKIDCSPLYNSVFASHITSALKCDLYRRGMGREIIVESIDGLSVPSDQSLEVIPGLGGLRDTGMGTQILLNDQYKIRSWDPSTHIYKEIAEEYKDKSYFEIPITTYVNLSTIPRTKDIGYNSLGESRVVMRRENLFSRYRGMDESHTTVGDVLQSAIDTFPLNFGEMKVRSLLQSMK